MYTTHLDPLEGDFPKVIDGIPIVWNPLASYFGSEIPVTLFHRPRIRIKFKNNI